MRALVTGATGFIGGALALRLIDQGWEVRLLLRNSLKSLPARLQKCQIFFCDLKQVNVSDLNAAVNHCDVVFHGAAIRNRWGTPAQDFNAINVNGTAQLLQASLGRVSRFVFLSSVGVFGYPGVLNIDESFPVIRNTSIVDYHTSKVAAEQLILEHSHEIETSIIRPTITYGPTDDTGMITRLIEMMYKRRFIQIGNGRNFIHLIYIDDLTLGLIQAATHPAAQGQTLLILSGSQPVQITRLLLQLETMLQVRRPQFFIPAKAANFLSGGLEGLYRLAANLHLMDPSRVPPVTRSMISTFCANRSFSSQKAMKLVNFQPKIDLDEGLGNTIEWMKSKNRLN